MTPDSPAGKAAGDLARRIQRFNAGESEDADPEYLASRFMADLVARGWRLTEAQAPRPELDPLRRKTGTPRAGEHAAAIRAQLRGGAA